MRITACTVGYNLMIMITVVKIASIYGRVYIYSKALSTCLYILFKVINVL